jgi:hypothetical protein
MFATPGDIPPQAFVRLDQFTAELIDLRADFRAALQQAIGALSESINAQFAKIHENTVHIDDRMRSQFEKVNTTAATNYERLDKRLFIVERDMQTRIQVHDELRADLTETALQLHTEHGALTKSVQSSAQRFTSLKTELSKQLEGVNNHLGNLQEDLTQVNATVESLVANQTGASKAMSFARRADEHVNEQGKMFQSFDNKLEAQAQMLEELQMKIIVSNEEVQAQIASCKETTHAWDKRLSKFDMTLFANESNNYGCSLWYQFVRNPSETAEAGGRVPPLEMVRQFHQATTIPLAQPRRYQSFQSNKQRPWRGSTRRCRQDSRHRFQRHMETVPRARRTGATKTHPMTGVPTIPNRETVAAGTRAQDQVPSDNRLASLTAQLMRFMSQE